MTTADSIKPLPLTPGAAAFFDVDGVILRGKGLVLFGRHLVVRRAAPLSVVPRALAYALGHRLGWFDGAAVLRRITARDLAGRPLAELCRQADAWFVGAGEGAIYAEARALIGAYRARGTPVILLSGGMDFLVAPIARALGATRFVAIRPEADGERLTGRLLEPLCIDEGKLVWARAIAAEIGVDLAASAFYGDDFGDLALLEAAGHPVAVNPDPRLRRVAASRGWQIARFA